MLVSNIKVTNLHVLVLSATLLGRESYISNT